jgi:tRNA dimethylallyltransferase
LQFYKQLKVGSALPSEQELSLYENYLFAFQDIQNPLTAGQFTKQVLDLLRRLSVRHPVCLMVGGSGFYIQSLISGMYEVSAGDADLSRQLREVAASAQGLADLWVELKEKDPQTAEKLHPNDSYRICRAVEIMRTTGKTLSLLRQEKSSEIQFPYPLIQIVLQIDKEALQKRVADRTESFLSKGWLDEVMKIQKQQGLDFPALRSVGYLQIVRALQQADFDTHRIPIEALKQEINQATLKLAKKQRTWFQKDWHPRMLRFHYTDHSEILKTVVDWVG